MPNEEKKNESVDEDFSAELYILEDMGISPDKLKNVKNKASALRIINYLEKKQTQTPPEEEPEKIKKNMLNVGGENDFELPDPEVLTDNIRKNMGDILNRSRPIHYQNCRWTKNARIMRYYEPGDPHGRVL